MYCDQDESLSWRWTHRKLKPLLRWFDEFVSSAIHASLILATVLLHRSTTTSWIKSCTISNAYFDEKNTEQPPLIDWDHPLKATHECYPETFSKNDIRNSYGRPFFIGLFRNFRRLIDPSYSKLMVMRQDKIQKAKKKYLKKFPKGTIISANDLITAGLCQSNESTDLFSFPLNMRGRKPQLDDEMAAGYLCCEIPFPKTVVLEPIGMRKIVSRKHFYETDQVPMEPFLRGRAGRMTNFASISSKYLFEKGPSGLEAVAHCLPSSFFEIFPIDVCVIYRLDKQHLGVIHNFEHYHENKLLDSMTVFSLEPKKTDERNWEESLKQAKRATTSHTIAIYNTDQNDFQSITLNTYFGILPS